MVFRVNSMDGPIKTVLTGSFSFDNLIDHADDVDNWDYWVLDDSEV